MSPPIPCPACQEMLILPESMLGKSVRCCKCQTVFTAPPPDIPELILLAEPVEPLPVPAPPAPPPFDWGAVSPRKRPSRRGEWGLLQAGLRCLSLSLVLGIGCFFALASPAARGLPYTMTENTQGQLPVYRTYYPDDSSWLLKAGLIVSTLAGLLGLGLCCAVPERANARNWAIGAAAANGIMALFSLALGSEGPLPSHDSFAWSVVAVAALIGTLCWQMFLLNLALHLDTPVLGQVVLAQFFILAYLVILVAPLFSPALAQNILRVPSAAKLYLWLLGGGLFAAFVAHGTLLGGFLARLNREMLK